MPEINIHLLAGSGYFYSEGKSTLAKDSVTRHGISPRTSDSSVNTVKSLGLMVEDDQTSNHCSFYSKENEWVKVEKLRIQRKIMWQNESLKRQDCGCLGFFLDLKLVVLEVSSMLHRLQLAVQ